MSRAISASVVSSDTYFYELRRHLLLRLPRGQLAPPWGGRHLT